MGRENKKVMNGGTELLYNELFFSPLSGFFYTAGMQRHLQKAFKSNCLMIQLEYNLHPARE